MDIVKAVGTESEDLVDCSERLISLMPITVRRRARFGECDPAGVVYTPVFSEYVMSAYQWTLSTFLGGPMLEVQRKVDFDSPMRALSLEFLHVLEPEQVFDMTVLIGEIRTRTFDLIVTGTGVGGEKRKLFVARVSPIIVSRSARQSMPIPEILRTKIEAYKEQTSRGL